MTTVEILRKAKAELQRRGWRQGAFGHLGSGPMCMVGAYLAVKGDYDCDHRGYAEAPAYVLLAKATGSAPYSVSGWNDATGRTVDEVYAAFDRAIALAEAQS